MRDVSIFLILAGLGGAALYRPWLGVLGLAVVAYMQPHEYAVGVMGSFPAFKFIITAIIAGMLISPETRSLYFYRQRLQVLRDWRLLLIGLLWLQFLFSTLNSWMPGWAWPKFLEISKIFLGLTLTLLLIDTKTKLRYLVVTITLTIGLVSLKGGFWAAITGSMDRVYGPPGSQYYDNNHFAVLNVMNIPLLLFAMKQFRERPPKVLIAMIISFSLLAALTSWSRGALLALGASTLVILWFQRKNYLIVTLLLGVGLIALSVLPADWFERMETLVTYQQESSAASRLEAWKDGLTYALHNPLFGVGPDGYVFTTVIAWHSAYITMLAEYGFPGIVLWLLLLLGTILSLSLLARCTARQAETEWATDLCRMLQASLVGYAVGAAFLNLAYWDILYHLVIISVLLSALSSNQAIEGPQEAKLPRSAS